MKVRFRPEAAQELLDAQAWYEARARGLGQEFARAVDSAVSRVQRAPQSFPLIDELFRRVLLRRFPYSLIYMATADELLVVSCFHHRRRPGSWKEPVA